MKKPFFAAVLSLVLLLSVLSVSVALAVVNVDACDSGDHDFDLIDRNDMGSGGRTLLIGS